jgi:hypothetical protein
MKRKHTGPDEAAQALLRKTYGVDDLGRFVRILKHRRWHIGGIAGTIQANGYRSIGFMGRLDLAHRLMWLYYHGEWPDSDIDHINGNRDDNRISNLRLATRSQNNVNSIVPKNNTSGYKGAYFDKRRGLWYAEIWVYKRKVFLGSYQTSAEAGAAYNAACLLHYGQFAKAESNKS